MLLQLPAELRLKILRFLLKTSGVILTNGEIWVQMRAELCVECSHDGPDREDFEQRCKAAMSHSAQILRTCQQIFREGQQILYSENALSLRTISTYDDYDNGQYLWILDRLISYPHDLSEHPPPEKDDLLSYAAACYKCHGTREDCEKTEHMGIDTRFSGNFASLRPMLERFQKFHVTIGYEDEDVANYLNNDDTVCHVAARAFRDIVRNKHVILHYKDFRKPHIDSCRLWRCASFHFATSSGPEAAEIEKLVCSSEPVCDTFAMWRSLTKQLKVLPRIGAVAFVNRERTLIELLKERALNYDGEAFEAARQTLVERIGEWMLEWADQADGKMPERGQ